MTVGSLFSGIGCGDLAAQRVGMGLRWACEIDPFCRRVYASHFPFVTLHGDIRELRGDALGPVDCIVFGWPCQDLSVAGRRAGLAGERSGLFYDACRVLEQVRPTWFVAENVPGLLSSDEGRDFLAVLRALGDLGYGVAGRVLDAQWFGVPQRRRRVYLVGCLGDFWRPAEVLSDAPRGGRHPSSRRAPRPRVAASLTAGAHGTGVNEPGRHAEDDVNLVVGPLMGSAAGTERPAGNWPEADYLVGATLNSGGNDGGLRTEPGEHPVVARPLKGGGNDRPDESHETYVVARALTAPASPRYDGDTENFVVAPTLRTNPRNNSNGGSEARTLVYAPTNPHDREDARTYHEVGVSPTLGATFSGQQGAHVVHALTAEGHDASEDGTGRGTPLVFNWQTGGSKPRDGLTEMPGALGATQTPAVLEPRMAVRRLTPVECERLMGLPDGWTAVDGDRTPDSPRYRALGNGMVMPVVEWIMRRIVAASRAARAEAVRAAAQAEIARLGPDEVARRVSVLSATGRLPGDEDGRVAG